MEVTNFKHGLVAFFDILGFQSFADVETDEDLARTARLVSARLVQIPHIQDQIIANLEGPLFLAKVGWCTFADSILLWCEIPPTEPEVYYWLVFFRVCSRLVRLMFNDGLPLRGAISDGKFFVEDHCFVGKPIVECHKLASRTVWGGCVVVPAAQGRLEKLWCDSKSEGWRTIMEQVCVKYKVPVKVVEPVARKAARRLPQLVIKWFHEDLWHAPDDVVLGIPDAVKRSFAAHGKRIPPDAILKMENTIQFLTFVDGLYANSNTPRRKPPH